MKQLTFPALFLAVACTASAPVDRELVVSSGNFGNVQGEARLTVRTHVQMADGERREVLGAACDLKTSLYEASLITPSRLKLPNFGPQSPELVLNCVAGDLKGSTRERILTRWDRPYGAYGYPYGPYGRYGYPWGYGRGYAYPVSSYPDVDVLLR